MGIANAATQVNKQLYQRLVDSYRAWAPAALRQALTGFYAPAAKMNITQPPVSVAPRIDI